MNTYKFYNRDEKLLATTKACSLSVASSQINIPWSKVECCDDSRIFEVLQYLMDRSAEKHMPHTPEYDKSKGIAYNSTIEYICEELLTDEEQHMYDSMQANPTCGDIEEYHKKIEDRLLEHLPWRKKSPKQNSSA